MLRMVFGVLVIKIEMEFSIQALDILVRGHDLWTKSQDNPE